MKSLTAAKWRGVQIGTAAITCAGIWKILFAARVRGAAPLIEYFTCWIQSNKAVAVAELSIPEQN
jgi:chromate transport protein ChrA